MSDPKPGQRHIAREWASYRERVLHDVESPVQIVETRRAFYAGAMAVMVVVMRVGEDDVSEDEGVQVFSGIRHELQAFAGEVTAGRA